ncbi:hypothetical protein HBN50_02950 [Halobacteriovorax sp. GB3]|uniref:hypothetical protein n=1 Tax=Halobacteriovorax sp. GB3 TaxID=2719615 RepID=UPI00235F4DEA|nr:hypothetical protein [Halobacteriovorax sp. GB3]MDD0852033.1 hypothetical protein [Halobacteriovorax sp. GB3]
MKSLMAGLFLLTSITSFATDLSVDYFLGKTYEGDKYIVEFASDLNSDGEVEAVIEEKKLLLNDSRDIPVVRISDGYIKFYFDKDVDNLQFFGVSGRLEESNGEVQFCFPLPGYKVDCLSEI